MQPLPDEEFIIRRRIGDSRVRENDVRLALAVVEELSRDERTQTEPVRVSAENDVVVLTGTVGSWAAREAASSVIRRAVPCADLCNAMDVVAGASDAPFVDEFDRVVAAAVPPRARLDSRQEARFHRTASSPMATAVVLAVWFVLFWLVVSDAVPVLYGVQIGLGVTGLMLLYRSLRTA